jgi:hypothetical protein
MRGWLVFVLIGLLGGDAFGQAYQPVGLKVGDGRLHLLGEVDSRFDSVVGFFSGFDAAGKPIPSPDFLFVPRVGLSFGLETPSTLVKLSANGEYLIFPGILSPGSRGLSRFQAIAGIDTAFNRDGAVEVQLSDNFSRSDRTQNAALGIGALSLFNSLVLGVPIHPGGRALEITPRINWSVEFFEALLTGPTSCPATNITCNPLQVGQMNYSNLNFAIASRFKFLPKTSAVLDVNFDYRLYFVNTTQNAPASILRGRAGLVGLITPRFSATLLAGAAYDFGSTRRAAPIGQAELTYLVADSTSVSVGYLRDLLPVPAFGAFTDDRGYVNGRVGLAGDRVQLSGTVSVDYFDFLAPMSTTSTRKDFLVGLNAGPTFVITSWFLISLSYGLSFRSSTEAGQDSINFTRHEANVRLTLRY